MENDSEYGQISILDINNKRGYYVKKNDPKRNGTISS